MPLVSRPVRMGSIVLRARSRKFREFIDARPIPWSKADPPPDVPGSEPASCNQNR